MCMCVHAYVLTHACVRADKNVNRPVNKRFLTVCKNIMMLTSAGRKVVGRKEGRKEERKEGRKEGRKEHIYLTKRQCQILLFIIIEWSGDCRSG